MRKNLTVTLLIGGVLMLGAAGVLVAFGSFTGPIVAADRENVGVSCQNLPSHGELRSALTAARNFDDGSGGDPDNGGFNLHMWGTIVNRDGQVCNVAFTGGNRGDQWPGSRVISAQKANTANAFSLPGLALSTANLFVPVQPGNSLFGLQESNPVDTDVAYGGNAMNYGQSNDPMSGKKIGGVNVFGGGLALYNGEGTLVGAVGVSGDTSCADHNIAWRTRNNLGLDFVPSGVSGDATRPDNIIFDLTNGFGHANCLNAGVENPIAAALPVVPTP